MEPLITTHRDVNNQKIEIIEQTQATVKTNKETIKLPPLITKATTTPMMGLDCMQWLGINMNTGNSGIQRQKIEVDETDKKIVELKNDFKNLFYHNRENEDLSVKTNLKEGATKRSTDTDTLERTSSQRIKTIDRKRLFGKSNRYNRCLHCKSGSIISEKRQVNKNCPGSRKLSEMKRKNKAQTPNIEELNSRISRKISEGED